MTFIEFVGFIIAMAAFFFLTAKQAKEQRRRREHPEEYEEELQEQDVALKQLMKSLNIDVPELRVEKKTKPHHPPPPPPAGVPGPRELGVKSAWKKPAISSELSEIGEERSAVFRRPHEGYREAFGGKEEVFRKPHKGFLVGDLHADAYKIHKEGKSRTRKVLEKTGSLKNAIILKEILAPPQGLRKQIPW